MRDHPHQRNDNRQEDPRAATANLVLAFSEVLRSLYETMTAGGDVRLVIAKALRDLLNIL